jgi:hypothetical protein
MQRPNPNHPAGKQYLPAFGEINTTYEKKVPSARASINDAQQKVFPGRF